MWNGNPDSVRRVLQHEIYHAMFDARHSSDPNCLMNINASAPTWCQAEVNRLVATFGAAVPEPPPPPPPPEYRWHNDRSPRDVNDDGRVSSLDALIVINAMARGVQVDIYREPNLFL